MRMINLNPFYKRFLITSLICGLLSIISIPAVHAERFLELYAGTGSIQDTNVTATGRDVICIFSCPPVARVTERVAFESSSMLGVRIGAWSDIEPWFGYAMDWSSFEAKAENVDITVTPLSFLFMLRWPMRSSTEFPKGQFQPYVGIGWSYYETETTVDFRPEIPDVISAHSRNNDLDVRAGFAWQFYSNVAIFGEYRATNYHVEALGEFDGFLVSNPTASTNLDTRHFLVGLSGHF